MRISSRYLQGQEGGGHRLRFAKGQAHALNMKESGVDVIVGLRAGKSWDAAERRTAMVVLSRWRRPCKAGRQVVMILVNDEFQGDLYRESIAANLEKGDALVFGHGFNIHFGQIQPRRLCRCLHGRAQGTRTPRPPR